MKRAARATKRTKATLKTGHASANTPSSRVSRPSAAQTPLPGLEFKKQLSFGGSLLKLSHAKTARPLSSKQALHVVLRSDFAQGERSLLRHERVIRNMLLRQGRRHGVKVYRVANAGNHLHLLVRFTKRRGLQNFLRGSSGLIARKVLGAERGRAKMRDPDRAPGPRAGFHTESMSQNKAFTSERQRFWSQRPFTRIVSWGKDFDSVLAYVKLNSLEALGFLSRKFTKALPSQAIRNRVLTEMSTALAGNIESRAPQTG